MEMILGFIICPIYKSAIHKIQKADLQTYLPVHMKTAYFMFGLLG